MVQSRDLAPWLREGIEAAKAGDVARAHALLSRVVGVEPENVLGWLWLSGVVATDDERRRCLQAVLAVDPDHPAARRGLAKLGAAAEAAGRVAPANETEVVVRRVYEPISPAAAILYPESQVREWRWRDLPGAKPSVAKVGFQPETAYDDVWTREGDLCPYCAHDVTWEEKHCPQCHKGLVERRFRFPRPSAEVYVYAVLLLGLGNLFLVQLLYDLATRAFWWHAVTHGLLMGVLWLVAVGVYGRRPPAYYASLALIPIVSVAAIVNRIDPAPIVGLISRSTASTLAPLVSGAASGLIVAIQPVQIAGAVLLFLYGIMRVGADFVQVSERRVAEVDRGLSQAGDYYGAGKRYADLGRWATAVMHWQRAVALDPARVHYQRALGQAYLRLGFRQRGLDMLEAAYDLATEVNKAELGQLLQQVRANE